MERLTTDNHVTSCAAKVDHGILKYYDFIGKKKVQKLFSLQLPYTRIFSSDKNFEGLNYVGINFRGLRTTC